MREIRTESTRRHRASEQNTRADDSLFSGHTERQLAHVSRLLGVIQWAALLFSAFCGLGFAIGGDVSLAQSALIIFAFFVLTFMSRRNLRPDNARRVAAYVFAAILIPCLALLAVQPRIYPTLALTSILSVALALPYVSERALKALMAAACASAVISVLVGPLMLARISGLAPPPIVLALSVSSLATAAVIAMIVLWHFRVWLLGAVDHARDAEQRASHRAAHDPLTELPNRARLEELLSARLARQSANLSSCDDAVSSSHHVSNDDRSKTFAVLFLDLDRFKEVNDSLGHALGDELLKVTARRLTSCVHPEAGDVVARLGGDEFVVLLDNVDAGDAPTVAERIRDSLSRPVTLREYDLRSPASVGVVCDCSGYNSPEDILRDADAAMFEAKKMGPGNVRSFDSAMRAEAGRPLERERDLRAALEDQQRISLCYEPIVWLSTREVIGFEVTPQLGHPLRPPISGQGLSSLAERAGLSKRLDLTVIKESCRQGAAWREELHQTFPPMVSVSVTASTVLDEGFATDVSEILETSGLPPHALMIVTPEEVVTERTESLLRALESLEKLEVRLALGDSGCGSSALRFMDRLPVDTLKLSPKAAPGTSAGAEADSTTMARSLVTIAQAFGLEVIATGVDTEKQGLLLSDMGVDHVQGSYYFAPVDASTALNILTSRYASS